MTYGNITAVWIKVIHLPESTYGKEVGNCFSLRKTLVIGPSEDQLRLARVDEAAQVTIADPPNELFEKPAGYRERPPSEVTAEFYRRYPSEPCPSCVRGGDREADEAYYKR